MLSLLSGSALVRVQAQDPPSPEASSNFFSGTVSEVSAARVTVSRNHLGKNESRTFLITQDTKVEGRLRPNARVTVRFRSAQEGEVAVHIIVRGASQAGSPRG